MKKAWCLIAVLALAACENEPGGGASDGGVQVPDSGTPDAGGPDAGPGDGGQQEGEAGHWRALSVPGVGTLNAVWGSGPRDVWAVGESGFIVHWDGEQWAQETRVPADFTFTLNDVWGSSAQDVWAVGAAGVILHFDGKAWQYVGFPEEPFCTLDICRGSLLALWGSSATDVWAVGRSDEAEGVVSHWDGTRWNHAVHAEVGRFESVWGSSATDVWAGTLTRLLHWNGETWRERATGTSTFSVPLRLWGVAANDVWGVNLAGEISHWDGVRWEEVALEGEDVGPLRAISGTGAGQMWAVGGSGSSRTLLHWEEGMWKQVSLAAGPTLVDLWVLPDGEAWAVGLQGSLLHRVP
ncbi:hypothetical protein JQX13_15750 [Archangium violaceum]|uniref:hypothetical protein n=1 Tax=Archangium violaceum TaxID=83451 RepID=UPI00193BFF00|nr:hypothetical protein [Archangium violaceum]QRK11393.1 hypothetical protein JQX13_15750 [Archangium violaceum]